MDINTEGLEQLILTVTEFFANFDLKALNFEGMESLLDKFYPIINPFWSFVNDILYTLFGF